MEELTSPPCNNQEVDVDANSTYSGVTKAKEISFVTILRIEIWENIRKCSAHSSFHGIPFLTAQRKFNLKSVLWIVFILTSVILMLYSLVAITSTFRSGGVYFTSTYHFPNKLKFPAVTLCNNNPFRVSEFLSNNFPLQLADLYLGYLLNTPGVRYLPVSVFAGFAQLYDAVRNGSNTLYREMGHRLENMLLTCTFDGRPCSVQNFTARPTNIGLCYTFNSNGDLHVNRPGHRYGLIVRLNTEQYEYFSSAVGSSGINVFIHEHDHFPYVGAHRKLVVASGTRTQMVLTVKRYQLLLPPNGQCNDHVILTYFKSYTRESCLIECQTQLTIRECGCKAEYMPGSVRTCTLNETVYCQVPYQRQFRTQFCDCPIPCKSVEYDIKESYSAYPTNLLNLYNNSLLIQNGLPLPGFAIRNFTYPNGTVVYYLSPSLTPRSLTENFVQLVIYYDALQYTMTTEELQYTVFRFIADFTGFMEFFIGAGFMTFFEVLELIYLFFKPAKINVSLV